MQQKTLHLTIGDEKVEWIFRVKNRGDEDYAVEKLGVAQLELQGPLKETIDLLVKLQRWLGDALADRTLPDDKMLALNDRLNDLARILGQNLYSVLFTGREEKGGSLANLLLEELKDLERQDLFRVQLEFGGKDEEETSSWPWEYMFIPLDKSRASTGQFLLAPHAQLVLTRRVYLQDKVPPLTISQPVMVLFVVCAVPQKLGPINYEKVLETLKALADTGAIKLITLIEPPFEQSSEWKSTATFQAFSDLVTAWQPHVIHFVGHGQLRGGKGELAFVDAQGEPDWRSDFAELAALSKQLKLVFLQACESALLDPHTPISSVARQCAHHNVPAVVAMQAKIENNVASIFVCSFYEALAAEKSVDYAVLEGRQAISKLLNKQAAAFGVPVLYLRSFEKLIGPKAGDEKRSSGSEGRCTCLRCKQVINRVDPKICTYCKLRFYCQKVDSEGRFVCNHKLVDPVNGGCCDECGTDFVQPLWPGNVVHAKADESGNEPDFAQGPSSEKPPGSMPSPPQSSTPLQSTPPLAEEANRNKRLLDLLARATGN